MIYPGHESYPPVDAALVKGHDIDPNADGRIALPQLEPAVASEAEVDGRISTHETGTRHRWTLDKLLKGAGLGADPTEIDVPAWQVLTEFIVPSPRTFFDFTGLDINTDKVYILFLNIKNDSTLTATYRLYVEGDFTATNYHSQYFNASGTTVAASRIDTSEVLKAGGSEGAMAQILVMRDYLGYFRAYSQVNYMIGLAVELRSYAACKNAPVTNITAIRLFSPFTGGIGVGSTLILCRLRS